MSNLYGGMGNAAAAGTVGGANALSGTLSGLGQYGQLAMMPQIMAALNAQQGGNQGYVDSGSWGS